MKTAYRQRSVEASLQAQLAAEGISPVMARVLAARGVRCKAELDDAASGLLPPSSMKGCREAGEMLANALERKQKLVVVADYDCDGATACAVMLRGLRMLGAESGLVEFVVPDRAVHGYGLTPPIVDMALAMQAEMLATVDNGIASFDGVAYAKQKGLGVIVTDHHLTATLEGRVVLPEADAIVNPNQPGCEFASKNICGAGVAFYVMLATRAALRERGRYQGQKEPPIAELLDLVALGTVADVVKLDANNRRLVSLGLRRINSGRAAPGITALLAVSGVVTGQANSTDMGYRLGPRVNAAGRLADMRVGIECLTAEDPDRAMDLAKALHDINAHRKDVEREMTDQAKATLDSISASEVGASIVVFNEGFHEGVIGIVAGRLKETWHRPTFVFAKSHEGTAKGSGRSIAGIHLRDVLDLVSKRKPGLLLRFGGHAMAAGVTVEDSRIDEFRTAFESECEALLSTDLKQRVIQHDGSLPKSDYTVETAEELAIGVWGQGFEQPLFVDEVEVLSQKIVGQKHLKLSVMVNGEKREGIWFQRTDPLKEATRLAYKISTNEWNGRKSVQMLVQDEV